MKEKRFSIVSTFFLSINIIIMLLVVIFANIDSSYIFRSLTGELFSLPVPISLIILLSSPVLSIFSVTIFPLHVYWFYKKKNKQKVGSYSNIAVPWSNSHISLSDIHCIDVPCS